MSALRKLDFNVMKWSVFEENKSKNNVVDEFLLESKLIESEHID
jgi:hypothetical protein